MNRTNSVCLFLIAGVLLISCSHDSNSTIHSENVQHNHEMTLNRTNDSNRSNYRLDDFGNESVGGNVEGDSIILYANRLTELSLVALDGSRENYKVENSKVIGTNVKFVLDVDRTYFSIYFDSLKKGERKEWFFYQYRGQYSYILQFYPDDYNETWVQADALSNAYLSEGELTIYREIYHANGMESTIGYHLSGLE